MEAVIRKRFPPPGTVPRLKKKKKGTIPVGAFAPPGAHPRIEREGGFFKNIFVN